MKIKKSLNSDTPITRVQMVLMKENEKEWGDFQKLFEGVVDTIAYVDYLDHGAQKQQKSKGIVEIGSRKKPFCCPQLWQRMFIHPDGIVTPCCIDSNRDLIMGNINESSTSEIWKNEKYQNLRNLHLSGKINEVPTCSKCPLAKY